MAKFNYTVPQDFLDSLGKIADVEKYAKVMINEAMPILKANVQRRVSADYSTAGREITFIKKSSGITDKLQTYKQTGALFKSIKASKAKRQKDGIYYAQVYFSGNDERKKSKMFPDGIPNAMKAIFLEYGRKTQSARPFIIKTLNESEEAILAKMQEVFNREAAGE